MTIKELLMAGKEFKAINKKGEAATILYTPGADKVQVTFEGEEAPKFYSLTTVQRGQGWKPVEENTNTPEAGEEVKEEAPEASEEQPVVIEEENKNEKSEEEIAMEMTKKFAQYGTEVVYIDSVHGKMATVIDKDGVDQPAHIDALTIIELSEVEEKSWEKIINPAAPSEDEKPEAPKAPRTNNGGGRKTDTIWKVQTAGFLASVLEGIKAQDPSFTKIKKVGDRNYIVFGAGKTGLSIVVSLNKKAAIIEFYGEGEGMDTLRGHAIEGYTLKEGAKNVRLLKEFAHDGTTDSIMDLVQPSIAEVFGLKNQVK